MEEKQTAPALTLEPDLSVPAVPTLTLDPEPTGCRLASSFRGSIAKKTAM